MSVTRLEERAESAVLLTRNEERGTCWRTGTVERLILERIPRLLAVLLTLAMWLPTGLNATWQFNRDRHYGPPSDNPLTEFDGGDGPGMCGPGMPNYWINTSNRNLVIEDIDFAYSFGPTLRVEMRRTFNSGASNGGFDSSWRSPYESYIVLDKENSIWRLYRPSGQVIEFEKDDSSTLPYELRPVRGYYNRLTFHGTYFVLEEKGTWHSFRYDLASPPTTVTGQSSTAEFYRLTQIAEPYGVRLTFSYNSIGKISEVIDAANRKTAFEYDGNGFQKAMTTPDGRRAEYEYDPKGYLLRSVDLLGTETTYTWGTPAWGDKRLLQSFTAGGRSYQFGWQNDSLVSVTDPLGNTTHWASFGEKTSPKGHLTVFNSDSDNGLTGSVISPNGHPRFTRYYLAQSNGSNSTNPYGFTSRDMLPDVQEVKRNRPAGSYTYREGYFSAFEWDEAGNLTKLLLKDISRSRPDRLYQFEYSARGDLTRETGPLGNSWQYEWNEKHRLVRRISPTGAETTFQYDSKGNLTRIQDPRGYATSFTYDPYGNVETITGALGGVQRFAYSRSGLNLSSLTDARGFVTQYTFDENDRLSQIINPDGSQRTFTYNCCAGMSSTDEEGNMASSIRNSRSQVIQWLDALGNAADFTYDADGNLTTQTDQLGHSTLLEFDEQGWISRVTDPLSRVSQFEYDEVGLLSKLIDPNSHTTAFKYNDVGLIASSTDPLGKTVQYKYDLQDRLTEVTNSRQQTLVFEYDKDDRLVSRTYPGTAPSLGYTYDAAGNLVKTVDDWGTTTTSYDANDLPIQRTFPSGKTATFTYDLEGNLTSVSYPDGLKVSYQYDSRNRPVRASWPGAWINLVYDLTGRPVRIDRSNGISTSFSYDRNGRFNSIRHFDQAGDRVDLRFGRDAAGRTVSETRLHPLPEVVSAEQVQISLNGGNQITQFGSETVDYDPDGNLVRTGSGFSAVYDPENRPTSITRDGISTTYTYDAEGHRVAATRGISTRLFHYDPFGNLLFETDAQGTVTTRYIYISDILFGRRVNDSDTFYHFDSRGSTLLLTDEDGDEVATYAYDPYGKVIHQSGSIYNPFTYVGAYGVMDEGDGLFFMANRYYDAGHQRFLQKDPLGYPDGLNLYGYVGGNPIDGVDPLGLLQWEAMKGITEGFAPGSTADTWLRTGFEATRVWRNGKIDYRLISKTLQAGTGIRLAEHYARTWVYPLLEGAATTVATTTGMSFTGTCAVAGAVLGTTWIGGGMILETVGKKSNMPRVEAAGKWMNRQTERAVDGLIQAGKKVKSFIRNTGYFLQGLHAIATGQ